MNRIAVLNLKGGIGKTTTAVSLAYILARDFNQRVLLIDCDMQGNASKVYNRYDPDSPGTHNVMTGSRQIENCIFGTGYGLGTFPGIHSGQIDIVPANMYLMQANTDVMRDTEKEQLHRLDNACRRLEDRFNDGAYTAAILDCALGLDMTVLNAVIAADLIIAPVTFGGYEVDGLQQLTEQLEDLKTIKPDIWLKVLFTMRQGNKTNREFEEWLQHESGYEVYKTAIRRSVTVPKATTVKKPLPEFSKRGAATKDYEALAAEVFEDLNTITHAKSIKRKQEREG